MSMATKVIRLMEELLYPDMPKLEDCDNEIDFLKKSWKYFNDKLFQGRLIEPEFKIFSSRLGAKQGMAGSYMPNLDDEYNAKQGTLSFGEQFITIPEVFEEILIHEMCHQAVEEIDKYSYNLRKLCIEDTLEYRDKNDKYFEDMWRSKFKKKARAHGKEWKDWAKRCGINASLKVSPHEEVEKLQREAEQKQAERMRQKNKSQFSIFG